MTDDPMDLSEAEQLATPGVVTDVPIYGRVPVWLVESGASDKSIRLFALMDGVWGDRAGKLWPSRKTMADALGCHVNSVDRSLNELRDLGAVTWERRARADGSLMSNRYSLHLSPPTGTPTPTGGGGGHPQPSRPPSTTSGAETSDKRTRPKKEPSTSAPASVAVAVTEQTERQQAEAVVREWWERQNPRPPDNFIGLVKIVEKLLHVGWTQRQVWRALMGGANRSTQGLDGWMRRNGSVTGGRPVGPANGQTVEQFTSGIADVVNRTIGADQ